MSDSAMILQARAAAPKKLRHKMPGTVRVWAIATIGSKARTSWTRLGAVGSCPLRQFEHSTKSSLLKRIRCNDRCDSYFV